MVLNPNSMSITLSKPAEAGKTLAGKYLTFTLQGESYGIGVLKVREIIRVANITAVPQMPSYIRGVINLRGKIIPVMDLRLKFEFTNVTNTEHTCIVVVQVRLADGKVTPMGLVVDGVEEVINFSEGDIEATPEPDHTQSAQDVVALPASQGERRKSVAERDDTVDIAVRAFFA